MPTVRRSKNFARISRRSGKRCAAAYFKDHRATEEPKRTEHSGSRGQQRPCWCGAVWGWPAWDWVQVSPRLILARPNRPARGGARATPFRRADPYPGNQVSATTSTGTPMASTTSAPASSTHGVRFRGGSALSTVRHLSTSLAHCVVGGIAAAIVFEHGFDRDASGGGSRPRRARRGRDGGW